MIPLRDDAPRFTRPWITLFLIALNVMIFLFQDSLNLRDQHLFVRQFGFVPVRIGAWLNGNMPTDIAFLPVLTSMFLHGGWWHLIGNMWFLWIFGDNVEDRLGHFGFLVFYLSTGLFGNFAHYLFNASSTAPTVGASGAIAGIMGAYFLLFPSARVLTLIPLLLIFPIIWIPAWFYLGYWFVLQFLTGAAGTITSRDGGIAVWAHVGGFLSGLAMIKILPKRRIEETYELG